MILKYVILAGVLFLAYRMFSGEPLLDEKRRSQLRDQEPDEDGYTDYEEVD